VLKGWTAVLSGGAVADVFIPFLVMTVLGVAMFAVGAILFRRRFV